MTRKTFNNGLLLAAASSISIASFATTSLADAPVFRLIEVSGGINAATLTVAQENGQWTRITDHPRRIPVHMNIQMSRGYVVFYRVGRNLTNGAVRGIMLTHRGNNSGTPIETVVDSQQSVSGTFNVFVGGGSRLNPTDEQAIVARCNAKSDKLSPGHSFSYTLPLALHADAKRRRRKYVPPRFGDTYKAFGDFARAAATGSVSLRIECLGDSKPPRGSKPSSTPPSGEPPQGTRLLSVSIRPKGSRTICPRPYVMTATIRASRKSGQQVRHVSYAIEKNGVRGKWNREQMWWDGTSFRLDVTKDFSLDPGKHSVRLILKNGKKSDVITTPEVTCPSFKVLTAKLQYNVVGGDKCPKQVWETATFTTTAPGEVKYSIINKGMQKLYGGWIIAKNHGSGYKAVAQRVLTMEAYKGLRGVKVLNKSSVAKKAWTQLEVSCPAVPKRDDGPKGLTGTKNPSHGGPATGPARIKIAVPPTSKPPRVRPGKRGKISIRCKRGFKLKGRRCVKIAQPAKRSIRCMRGFKPVRGKCVKVRRSTSRSNARKLRLERRQGRGAKAMRLGRQGMRKRARRR